MMHFSRRGFIASLAAFVGLGPRLSDLEVARDIIAATGFTPRVVIAPLTTFEQIMGTCLRHFEKDGKRLAEVALRLSPHVPGGNYDPRMNELYIMEVHDKSPEMVPGELVGYTRDGRVATYRPYHESAT